MYSEEKESFLNLLKFVGESFMIAHNSSFDLEFLNKELEHWSLPQIPQYKLLCTKYMMKYIIPYKNKEIQAEFSREKKFYTLSNYCEFFEIKFDNNLLHRSSYDSILTAKLFIKLLESWNKIEDKNKFTNENSSNFNMIDDFQEMTQNRTDNVNKDEENLIEGLNHDDLSDDKAKLPTKKKEDITLEDNNMNKRGRAKSYLLIFKCYSPFDNEDFNEIFKQIKKIALKLEIKFEKFIVSNKLFLRIKLKP